MSDYAKLCEELRRLSETNSMSFYKRQVCKEAADAIKVLQAAIEAIAGDCIELRTEVDRLKTEQSTEYMRGLKYAIYEIMKEADIRGSQEIRDSEDTDDEMCAAVAVKIREAIDDAVDDAIHRIKKEHETRVANINTAEYSKVRWNGKEWEIYMGYPIGHVSLNAELERLLAERDAAVKDMTRIATFASECEMCSHRIGKSGCPDRYTIGCNFNWRGVQHDSEKEG